MRWALIEPTAVYMPLSIAAYLASDVNDGGGQCRRRFNGFRIGLEVSLSCDQANQLRGQVFIGPLSSTGPNGSETCRSRLTECCRTGFG